MRNIVKFCARRSTDRISIPLPETVEAGVSPPEPFPTQKFQRVRHPPLRIAKSHARFQTGRRDYKIWQDEKRCIRNANRAANLSHRARAKISRPAGTRSASRVAPRNRRPPGQHGDSAEVAATRAESCPGSSRKNCAVTAVKLLRWDTRRYTGTGHSTCKSFGMICRIFSHSWAF
jgi:hypothetical protein